MNAKLISKDETTVYAFELESEGETYFIKVWLNNKSKFIDDEICYANGDELEHEGAQGEIREKIMEYLDKNWDSLVQ